MLWAARAFVDELTGKAIRRYEGTAVRPQGRIADACGKYIFAEEGSHESFYAGEVSVSLTCLTEYLSHPSEAWP